MRIVIDVAKKIATSKDGAKIVCGNSDYEIEFAFDSEWSEHEVKTARFTYKRYGKVLFDEIVFTGNVCPVPVLKDILEVSIGVYAGNLSTSTPAVVECEKSILCGSPVHEEPPEDVYHQIVELCEDAVKTAESVEERANNGEFNGDSYVLTETDKQEIAEMAAQSMSPIVEQATAAINDLYANKAGKDERFSVGVTSKQLELKSGNQWITFNQVRYGAGYGGTTYRDGSNDWRPNIGDIVVCDTNGGALYKVAGVGSSSDTLCLWYIGGGFDQAFIDDVVGEIETALDSIISIQNALIGGDSE